MGWVALWQFEWGWKLWQKLLQSPFAGFLMVAVLLIDMMFFNPGR